MSLRTQNFAPSRAFLNKIAIVAYLRAFDGTSALAFINYFSELCSAAAERIGRVKYCKSKPYTAQHAGASANESSNNITI